MCLSSSWIEAVAEMPIWRCNSEGDLLADSESDSRSASPELEIRQGWNLVWFWRLWFFTVNLLEQKSLQYVGSRWRKTLALSEKQKQALEFGKDFAAALSLLLSIGFKCLKKPTRCTSSTWHLHLFSSNAKIFAMRWTSSMTNWLSWQIAKALECCCRMFFIPSFLPLILRQRCGSTNLCPGHVAPSGRQRTLHEACALWLIQGMLF